jgi:hypothetical protein
VGRAPATERGAVVGTFTALLDVGFGLGPMTLGAAAALVGIPGALLAGAVAREAGIRTDHRDFEGGT